MENVTATTALAGIFRVQASIIARTANQRNTYSYAAALTFCAYDTMLSFGQEITYVWGSKWSPVKALYVIVRYYAIVNLIALVAIYTSIDLSIKVCQRFALWIIPGGLFIFVVSLDAILLLRVFALYKCNKQVFTVLLMLLLAEFVAVLWASISMARHLAANIIVMPSPWQGCTSELPTLKLVLVPFVLNYTLSLLFLAMTVWKLLANHQHLHGKLTWKTLHNLDNVSPLLLAFVRDGSIFFALASVTTFLGLIVPFMVNGPTKATFLPWTLALYSYSGSHLILDLRAAGTKGNGGSTWNDALSSQYRPDGLHNSITFASPPQNWQ